MKCPAYNHHTVFLTMLGANLIMLTMVSCILLFGHPSGILTDVSGIGRGRDLIPAGTDVLESDRRELPVSRLQANYVTVGQSVVTTAGSQTRNFGPASGRVNLLCAQAQNAIPDMNHLLQMSF